MASTANFRVVGFSSKWILIQDLGPWDQYKTITNAAESVVASIASAYGEDLGGRRLAYIDSEEDVDELVVRDGRFANFEFLSKSDLQQIQSGIPPASQYIDLTN